MISSCVLDLSELEFIDQHGIMRIAKRAAETDGLKVRNVPAPTQRLCEPAGCRDMSAGARPCAHGDAFRHEAFFYGSDDAFLEGTLAFVRDGIEAGEPTLVVVDSRKIELIRAALNGEAAKVSFLDMMEVGRNPARIIPLWRRFADEATGSGTAARGIGEPIWAARTSAELAECQRHESLLNVAFDEGKPWSLLCPYDSSALPDDVLEAARRSHPVLSDANGGHPARSTRGKPVAPRSRAASPNRRDGSPSSATGSPMSVTFAPWSGATRGRRGSRRSRPRTS